MLNIVMADTQEILSECMKVRNQVFTIEKNVPVEIEVDDYDVLDGICDHFLIKSDEVSVGAMRCKHLNDDKVKLQRFCILKEYRGLDYGKKSIELVEDTYRNQDISYIEIDSKYNVHEFYEKCGYTIVSDVFIEADVPHVKMTKTL